MKKQYRIRNWSEYNKALKNRGRPTIWLEEGTIEAWKHPKVLGKKGRPFEYSNEAIICALMVRLIFNLPLRAAEGFLESMFQIMRVNLPVPDYTLICKRQKGLELPKLDAKNSSNKQITDIVIDSTGVKVYGEGEWKVRTHGADKRRKWRKIHVGIDPETGEIVAEKMTDNDEGDPESLPELLSQIEGDIGRVIADGAYDTRSCYDAIIQRNAQAIIPPRKNACLWPEEGPDHPRNKSLIDIELENLKIWKKKIGYHIRSLVETTMLRLKKIFTGKFKSREFDNQRLESRLMCVILNKMTHLGMPISYPLNTD